MPWKAADLTKQVFGRLTVLSLDHVKRLGPFPSRRVSKRYMYRCQCACGNICVIDAGNLKFGTTQSCGCLQRDRSSAVNMRHGQCRDQTGRTAAWTSWYEMLRRTGHTNKPAREDYAGVYVDPRWLVFDNFAADMGACPQGHTLDRIRAELGYRPGNCRWATPKTQAENRKTTRWLAFDGLARPIYGWADILGVCYATLVRHLVAHNHDMAAAVESIAASPHCGRRVSARLQTFGIATFR